MASLLSTGQCISRAILELLRAPSRVSQNILIALWISLSANGVFLQKISALTPYQGFSAGLFLVATFLLLWAYLNTVLQLITWGRLAKPVLSLMLLVSALTGYFVYNFGVGIDRGQIQNMLETDVNEVRDLVTPFALLWLCVFALLPMLWLWRTVPPPLPRWSMLKQKALALGASILIILAMVGCFYVDYAAIFRENRTLRDFITPHNSLGALLSHYKRAHQKNTPTHLQPYGQDAVFRPKTGDNTPRLVLLVLGETARAESFALNGYARNTTPELKAQQVINFSQVSSCGTATAVSLPCLFSGMTRQNYDPDLAKHREGLLDMAQRAGYAVTWIDNNSGCKGVCDRVEQVPVLESKKNQWCVDGECQDGILRDTLDDFLRRAPVKNRLIVLHQAGSHGPAYYRRYPKDFARFTPTCDTNAIQGCSRDALVNTYDNTIAYTDHVLSGLIDQLKGQTAYQTAFWYVSDHGESTGEHGLYLHGAPYLFAPSQQTHVPMLAWFSPQFAQQHSGLSACLQQKTGQTLSHDHVFHSFLGLLNIQSQVYNPELDLTGDCRQIQP